MELPKGFSLEDMMSGALPADTTLGSLRDYLLTTEEIKALINLPGRSRKLRILFLDRRGREHPDGMTLGEFRSENARGNGSIAIDDGSGGVLEPA